MTWLALILIYLIMCIACLLIEHLRIISDDQYFSDYATFIDGLRDEYELAEQSNPILTKTVVMLMYLLYILSLPFIELKEWLGIHPKSK